MQVGKQWRVVNKGLVIVVRNTLYKLIYACGDDPANDQAVNAKSIDYAVQLTFQEDRCALGQDAVNLRCGKNGNHS